MTTKSNVGFYGKLPVVGDFISRRLPKDFIAAIDAWMQQGLSVSKEILGDNWLDLYLTSPVWRFSIQAGVCGENAWIGIMMPSVDKVGRYFPLILAYKVTEENKLGLILTHCSTWFEKLEEVALAGLEEKYNLDEFNEAVLAIETPNVQPIISNNDNTHDNLLSTHLVSGFELNEHISQVDALMLAGLDVVQANDETYSFWLNTGSDDDKGSVMLYKGLPSANDYSKMIG